MTKSLLLSLSTILLMGVVILTGCTSHTAEESPSSTPTVRVVRIQKESFQPSLKTFGTLTYMRKADVFSPQEGTIETLRAEEGDRVSKGQVLATLSREKLFIAREQAAATVACRVALLDLAEEKLSEGYRSVEARILAMEKAEAELAQKRVEYAHVSEVWETKKKLFQAGGIPGGDLEAIRTQYAKSKTEWEQSARDLEIQRIGLRDEDLIKAGYGLPGSKEERITLLKEVGTRTLQAERNVAQGELSIARAELHRIELLLSETEIRSPLSGVVSQRAIEIGEKVSPESLLFSLYDPETLYAQVELHERDIPRIQIGQFAQVELDAPNPIPPMRGKVRLVTPYLNPQSRSTLVKILLDPPYNTGTHLQLFPGMFVRVRIPMGPTEKVIRIPESAVLEDLERLAPEAQASSSAGEGKGKPSRSESSESSEATTSRIPGSSPNNFVFIVRNATLFKAPVVLGDRSEGKVTVRSGIEEGDRIVVNPSRGLVEGERVEVLE